MRTARCRGYWCVGLFVILSSSLATAQPARPTAPSSQGATTPITDESWDSLVYEFDDDLLNALGQDAQGMLLRVRPGAAWVVLLRPRVQFVSELLQSVEAL